MWESISQIGLGAALAFIFNHFFSPWYKGYIQTRFENDKSEKSHNLQLERELLYKELEFDKIKLERVLPELEKINNLLYLHRMMFNSYLNWVLNKCGDTKGIEKERVELDNKIIQSISNISIYVPNELRSLLNTYRKLISCSWTNPETLYNCLIETERTKDILESAQQLYDDLNQAFYEMIKDFLGLVETGNDYSKILERASLEINDNVLVSTRKSNKYITAWKWIILHEYYGSIEKIEILEQLKKQD